MIWGTPFLGKPHMMDNRIIDHDGPYGAQIIKDKG
jgi:hypothetical protein